MRLTINGREEAWLDSSFHGLDQINARSSCSFTVDTMYPVTVGQEVIITDDSGNRVFGGSVGGVTRSSPAPGIRRYAVTCVDFCELADRRLAAETYANVTAGFIARDILGKYLAAEGVTEGTIPDGPVITKAVFNYKKPSTCFDYLKDVTGLNWKIDAHKRLNLFYREDYVGAPFTDALDNFEDATVEEAREEYRNRQILRAGQGTTDTIIKEKPSPKPDGVSRKFSLRYPVAAVPTLYLNDTEVPAGNVGINGVDRDKVWYWNKGSKDIVQDSAQAALVDSDKLEVTYRGLVPIVVQVNDTAGQAERQALEGGTGVYEGMDEAASIDDRDAALAYAKGLLQKWASIPQKVHIQTREIRQAGSLVHIEIASLDLNGDYLVESVTSREEQGSLVYDLTCLSGESLGSWVEFFRKLRKDQGDFLIRENEVLVLLQEIPESEGWEEAMLYTTFACPVLQDNLYPSDTLYPC